MTFLIIFINPKVMALMKTLLLSTVPRGHFGQVGLIRFWFSRQYLKRCMKLIIINCHCYVRVHVLL